MNARMMNENVKAVNDVTTPAPYFWYDHIREKICGTELNFKKSGDPGSAQDKALMCAKREHPDYGYDPIKPQKEKNSYKGLKRELMHDYIDCFGTDEMIAQFNQMKKDGTAFATMKSWFLDLFPHFNVDKAKRDITKHRLGNVKAKYKVVRVAPNKPSPNISGLPMASGE